MYSLLIVDDEDVVLELLRESIDWVAAGIEPVYTAHSKKQAQGILLEHPVDIVLCDIEMPMGSGISLLEWIRERQLETVNIILTGHASFEYARRAMELGSIAYILKPISLEEIRKIVSQAAGQVKSGRQAREYQRYGESLLENRDVLSEQFWREMLMPPVGGNRRLEVQNAARRRSVAMDRDMRYALALISSKEGFAGAENDWDATPAVKNMMSELLPRPVCPPFEFGGHLCCVLSWEESGLKDAPDLIEEGCGALLEACEGHLNLRLSCYISDFTRVEVLYREWEKLAACERTNVAFYGVFFHSRLTNSRLSYTPPDIRRWQLLLTENGSGPVIREAEEWLDGLVARRQVNASVMELFFQDYLRMLHLTLQEAGVPSNTVFHTPRAAELFRLAPRSMARLKEWIRYMTEQTERHTRTERDPATVTERAREYIDCHILGGVSRSEIAAHVHLSPEHLSRLFRKAEGVSLVDYVTDRKMATAKSLLRGTDLPVGEIASKLGYSNFAYFSQLFRKQTGFSPGAWRRLNDSQLSAGEKYRAL